MTKQVVVNLKTEVVHIRISHELKEKVKELADKENRTISNYVENIISKEVKNRADE